jgi:hypothetical protein
MLLNFARFGKMKGMGQIIAWSIADESLHCESMIRLFREFIKENKDIWTDQLKAQIYTVAEKMVELEDKFIDLAFGVNEMEGLTKEDVKQYIRYIADRRLISLGMRGIFKVRRIHFHGLTACSVLLIQISSRTKVLIMPRVRSLEIGIKCGQQKDNNKCKKSISIVRVVTQREQLDCPQSAMVIE